MPLTFREAVEFAKQRRVALPTEYYGELQGQKRDAAFSIAGVAQRDQLQGVLDSMTKVLGEGMSFADWKNMVKGGEIGLDLPDYRLNNIFRTNMQVSYNHGHYVQQQKFKATRPYLMYDAVNDSRVRPSHLSYDNVIRPVDDAFWFEHYPPNGYQCRCSTISLTEAQAQARGGVTPEPTNGWQAPDKGWDYNPGTDPNAGIEQAMEPGRTQAQLQRAMEKSVSSSDASTADLINVIEASREAKNLEAVMTALAESKSSVLQALSEGTLPGATEPITVREAQDFSGSSIVFSDMTEEQQAFVRVVSDEARAMRNISMDLPENLGFRGDAAKSTAKMTEDVFAELTIPAEPGYVPPTLYKIPPRGDVKVLSTKGEPVSVSIGGQAYTIGETVTQKGFMTAFAKEPISIESTMFAIETHSSAVPTSFISATPAELEWMFPPEAKFTVKRIDGNVIFLEEVQP